MMKNPVVEAALEMGFSRRLIKQTIQSKILRTGENYKTINDLVSDLVAAEDESREEEKEAQVEETTPGKNSEGDSSACTILAYSFLANVMDIADD